MPIQFVDPARAKELIDAGAQLVDIRTASEFKSEHINGAAHLPMSSFEEAQLKNFDAKDVIFYCQSDSRAKRLIKKIQATNTPNYYVLEGGISAWKKNNFSTQQKMRRPFEMQRQIHIVAGSLILLGFLLANFVSNWFYLLPLFVGAGLLFAGLTGFCGMAILLMKMPWNQMPLEEPSQSN